MGGYFALLWSKQPAPAGTPATYADASKPDIDINQAIDNRLADLKLYELRESVVSFKTDSELASLQ